MTLVLAAAGVFSVGLGVWHLGVPRWFDFRGAIGPDDGRPGLRPLRFGPITHATTRRDVLGLSWVMSNAASYVLISIGVADLAAPSWLGGPSGGIVAGWIAGWWTLRAASELALGLRRIDGLVMAVFVLLALVHVAAIVS